MVHLAKGGPEGIYSQWFTVDEEAWDIIVELLNLKGKPQ